MRITHQKVSRQGDKVTVKAAWLNKFKRPIEVKVTFGERTYAPGVTPMISGDVLDVHGFLFGCASLAWALGWRPAGFMKAMNQWVADYKPEAR